MDLIMTYQLCKTHAMSLVAHGQRIATQSLSKNKQTSAFITPMPITRIAQHLSIEMAQRYSRVCTRLADIRRRRKVSHFWDPAPYNFGFGNSSNSAQ